MAESPSASRRFKSLIMILFSAAQYLTPHFTPHKIRVTEGISLSALDLIEGVGLRIVGPCVSNGRVKAHLRTKSILYQVH